MKARSIKIVAEALHETMKDKSGSDLSRAIAHAALFLKKNQLLGKSKEILTHLQAFIDHDEKVIRATVTSASILPKKMLEELEESLQKRYKAKNVEIDSVEDKNIVSGIKIEVGDEILDLTLANRLHQLQTYLIKN